MKKKIVIGLIITLLIISGVIFYVFTKEDKNTTLNLIEKQWIEKNKNVVIDMGVANNIPVFNNNGEGLFFDFLNSLEQDTELSFNLVPYNYLNESNVSYKFKIVDEVNANDILIYKDNYVLLTKNKKKYLNLKDIESLTVGVLNEDLEKVNNYLDNNNLAFKTYETIEELFSAIKDSELDIEQEKQNDTEIKSEIDALVVPKLIYMGQINEDDLYISYNITELIKNYVLSLGKTERLNDILIKYYDKWSKDNFNTKFNTYFTNNYFSFKKINEKERVNFRSKRYVYGFVENAPYDNLSDNKLYGINNYFIKKFAKLANIEITYQKYKNYNALLEAFNSNKIDFMINFNDASYDMDVINTNYLYDNEYVILSNVSNNLTINSLKTLQNKEILAIDNTYLSSYLQSNNITVKNYDNIHILLENMKKNSIIAIDKNIYEFFIKNELKNYKIDLEGNLNNSYTFLIRDIKDNSVFASFFDFYLSFVNNREILNNSYYELISNYDKPSIMNKIYLASFIILIIGAITFVIMTLKKIKKRNTKIISKEDKLKYIDLLTSLKNRNYLNDNIEKWDASEVYPQAILVVDLNNIAYINDNYGHNEGDNIIKEAANILILNQEENSDIIRTSGNEFLIYLVGHDEKSVVNYKRKLLKEFKDLSHGFGAAIGYSMIVDGIKTIDDAINEATLDMRDNKENSNI